MSASDALQDQCLDHTAFERRNVDFCTNPVFGVVLRIGMRLKFGSVISSLVMFRLHNTA